MEILANYFLFTWTSIGTVLGKLKFKAAMDPLIIDAAEAIFRSLNRKGSYVVDNGNSTENTVPLCNLL